MIMVAWSEIEESFKKGLGISKERFSDFAYKIVSDSERIRLKFEIRKVDKRINECYKIIGENVFENILKERDFTKDKEMKRIFDELNNLLLERKKMEGDRNGNNKKE